MTTTKALSVGTAEREVAEQITAADAEILILKRRLTTAALNRDVVDEVNTRLTSLSELRVELSAAIPEARQRDMDVENERRLDIGRRQFYSFNVKWMRDHRAVVLRLENLLADARQKEQQFLDEHSSIHGTLRQKLAQDGAELELPSEELNDAGDNPAAEANRFRRIIAEIDKKWAERDNEESESDSAEV